MSESEGAAVGGEPKPSPPPAAVDGRAAGRAHRVAQAAAGIRGHDREESRFDKLTAPFIRFGFRLLSAGVSILPLSFALWIGASVARLLSVFMGKRRRIALEHLERSFGDEKSPAERRRIVNEALANSGRMFVEFLRLGSMDEAEFRRRVTIDGLEHLEASVAAGHGTLCLSGHLGNFEFIAGSMTKLGVVKAAEIVRKIKPPVVNDIVIELRNTTGVETISNKNSVLDVFRRLRKNEGIGVVLDQNMRRGLGVFVDFFGVAASTTPGLAIMALRSKARVLPIFIVREGPPGHHRMVIGAPLELTRTGNRDRDALVNTQRFTWLIEDWVRRYPEQWLWFHQRWRTRPLEEQGGPAPTGDAELAQAERIEAMLPPDVS